MMMKSPNSSKKNAVAQSGKSQENQEPVTNCDHKKINIESLIRTIRGQKVMVDFDLAMLYGVQNKRLNEQVKRNIKRFPDDFMFQLTKEEWNNLKSQIATSSWGGARKLPFAFTVAGIT
jgi:hypothetical protein